MKYLKLPTGMVSGLIGNSLSNSGGHFFRVISNRSLVSSRKATRSYLKFGPGSLGFPDGASGKEPARQCRRCKRYKFDHWVGKVPWRRV